MRLRWRAATIAAVLAVGVATALLLRDQAPSFQARQVLQDPGRFSSTTRAVDALLDVADLATKEVPRCRHEHRSAALCDSWGGVAAYARVGAATTLECTEPGRDRVRRQVLAYVEDVLAVKDSLTVPVEPPAVPSCR